MWENFPTNAILSKPFLRRKLEIRIDDLIYNNVALPKVLFRIVMIQKLHIFHKTTIACFSKNGTKENSSNDN